MRPRPPRSTRTNTLLPYPTLVRSEYNRKDGIIRRVVSALSTAPGGGQELDCMISYALELARGEFDQVMMELLVNEGFSWHVISEIWEDRKSTRLNSSH